MTEAFAIGITPQNDPVIREVGIKVDEVCTNLEIGIALTSMYCYTAYLLEVRVPEEARLTAMTGFCLLLAGQAGINPQDLVDKMEDVLSKADGALDAPPPPTKQ